MNEEKVIEINVERLKGFKGHPFRVNNDQNKGRFKKRETLLI